MMKPLLAVLGASSDQRYLIETAQDMGLEVVAFDMDEDAASRDIADAFACVSTRDVPALIRAVDDFRAAGRTFAGVMTMGSDIPQIVAAVAAHLGTPGPSLETAAVATDKVRMKERFAARGIPIPWFRELDSFEQLERVRANRGDALVLKPVDRSGSRGVFDLRGVDDIRSLYDAARDISFEHRTMVEDYLPGLQISTETVMYRGKGATPGFADRNYEMNEFTHPQVMENGGVVPSAVNAETRSAVETLVERAALALGITDGVAKGDVVIAPEGPKMIEVAGRLSGGDFCESLVPLGSGVNYVRAAVRIAIGETPDFADLAPKFDRAVANRYFFPPTGRLVRVDGVEAVSALDWVKKLEFWYRPGDMLPELRSHADRFGVFVAVADTRDELERRIRHVYDTIDIVVEPL